MPLSALQALTGWSAINNVLLLLYYYYYIFVPDFNLTTSSEKRVSVYIRLHDATTEGLYSADSYATVHVLGQPHLKQLTSNPCIAAAGTVDVFVSTSLATVRQFQPSPPWQLSVSLRTLKDVCSTVQCNSP